MENISILKNQSAYFNTQNESHITKKNSSNLVFQDQLYEPENNALISSLEKNQENYIKLLSYPVGFQPYSIGFESLAFQIL
ncbi:hypothetical protein AYI70_g930 [Smittium culicis]|uniref:Uncharacterized protein n=1 Tax=Smittium culicis TaxID=133412 RepID=A0A1R1YES9_9FUNG|nr:hypothetical protein AYI70_g930 [Smittium culicis]